MPILLQNIALRCANSRRLMFNPHPKIQLIPIPGHPPCVVVDDFLRDPQALVDGTIQFRESFVMAPHNAFPGVELRMPDAFSARLNDFFIQYVRDSLGARRVIELYSRLSMVTLQPPELSAYQRLCHRDRFTRDPARCYGALVLYLFHDSSLGGTSFYAPKIPAHEIDRMYALDSEWGDMPADTCTRLLGAAPAYLTTSNPYFELLCTVPAAWNRAIFYDGSIFHSAHIEAPERLSSDPEHGRLTLNGFFTCRRAVSNNT
jgi:hypothetical protein